MSGGSLGGLGDMLNGGGGMQTFDPVGSLGTNAINSIFGTNFLGQGGMSNNWATHVGNGPLGANLFNAGNPTVDAQNAANAAANPSSIGQLGTVGGPQFHDPTQWGMPTPQGGFWNQIAQQMAGPVYTGGLQIPGVSPAMSNQPIGQPTQPLGSTGLANMSGANLPIGGGGKGVGQPTHPLGSTGLANMSGANLPIARGIPPSIFGQQGGLMAQPQMSRGGGMHGGPRFYAQ